MRRWVRAFLPTLGTRKEDSRSSTFEQVSEDQARLTTVLNRQSTLLTPHRESTEEVTTPQGAALLDDRQQGARHQIDVQVDSSGCSNRGARLQRQPRLRVLPRALDPHWQAPRA